MKSLLLTAQKLCSPRSTFCWNIYDSVESLSSESFFLEKRFSGKLLKLHSERKKNSAAMNIEVLQNKQLSARVEMKVHVQPNYRW